MNCSMSNLWHDQWECGMVGGVAREGGHCSMSNLWRDQWGCGMVGGGGPGGWGVNCSMSNLWRDQWECGMVEAVAMEGGGELLFVSDHGSMCTVTMGVHSSLLLKRFREN